MSPAIAQNAAASAGAGGIVGVGEAVGLGSVDGERVGLGAIGDGVADELAVGGAVGLTELPQAVASRTLRRPTTSGRARAMAAW